MAVSLLALSVISGLAQLAVSVSPAKVTGQKAFVPLAMKNNFTEKVESTRAVVFLLDEQRKAMGQPTTRWVIGGSEDKPGLPAGATNVFNFVIAVDKPFTTTNLTAKVQLRRVVLEGGKTADAAKSVSVTPAAKSFSGWRSFFQRDSPSPPPWRPPPGFAVGNSGKALRVCRDLREEK